jgi:2-isopropylmalate synthase
MADIWFTWNSADMPEPVAPEAVRGSFFDETLRDGIQAPHVAVPHLDQKLQLVEHMVSVGIGSADLGFPGSGPRAAAECQAIARHLMETRQPIIQGYAGRTHPDDVRAICELSARVGVAVEAYIFIGVSPIRQYVEDLDARVLFESIRSAAAECRRSNVEFVLVLEDAVRCTPALLGQVYDVALELGVRRLALCDTVGAAQPHGARALVNWTHRYFTGRGHEIGLEWHGHNDRGLALANSLAALAAGCVRVHGTVLGVGERAGNASIDQLVLNRHLERPGEFDLAALRTYCEYASTVLDVGIPPNYPAMGRDVFTTSAGVHAAAILKAHEKADPLVKDSVYSSVPASVLGREQEVLIDGASGASNVRYWLAMRGQQADDASIQKVLVAAKTRQRPLDDEEIGWILATHR